MNDTSSDLEAITTETTNSLEPKESQVFREMPPSFRWPVWRPLLAVLLLSVLIRTFEFDQKISGLCYDSVRGEWPFETAEPWLWFYRNGTLPPMILGIAGAVIALFGAKLFPSMNSRKLNRTRRYGAFLALLLLIGPGLLVNASLKSLWGRPRPLQCREFGGEMKFLPVGEWAKQSFPNSSFPSGHASVAFFLMGLGFVVSPRRPWLRWGCFVGGMAYGLAMGFTRVLQGGHFLSDVLWAGAIVYFVGVGLERILIQHD